MPIISIPLVPPSIDQKVLRKLVEDVQAAAASIPELGITADDVTVLLPADILSWGVGSELPVTVNGLFKKPERDTEVLNRLWSAIGTTVSTFAKENIPWCAKVEVIPANYDQDRDGFWLEELTPTTPLPDD